MCVCVFVFLCANLAGVSEELRLTRHRLDRHSEEALDFSLLADNSHLVDQGNRAQQVTQVNGSPEEEAAWNRKERSEQLRQL